MTLQMSNSTDMKEKIIKVLRALKTERAELSGDLRVFVGAGNLEGAIELHRELIQIDKKIEELERLLRRQD